MAVEWVRLQLDLEAFEGARFEPYLQGCRQSGIDFTAMACDDLPDLLEGMTQNWCDLNWSAQHATSYTTPGDVTT